MNINNLPTELNTLIFNQLDDVDKYAVSLVNKDFCNIIKITDFHRLITAREQVTKTWLGYFETKRHAYQSQFFIGIETRGRNNFSSRVISLVSHIALLFFSKTDREREIARQQALNDEITQVMLKYGYFRPCGYEWQTQIEDLKKVIFPIMHGRTVSSW